MSDIRAKIATSSQAPLQRASFVFFDGACGFCSRSVLFLMFIDRSNKLFFSSLQGPTARRILGTTDHLTGSDGSMVIFSRGQLKIRADAVLLILLQLKGIWPWLSFCLHCLPRPLLHAVYRLIARNRHRFTQHCRLDAMRPTDIRHQLLP